MTKLKNGVFEFDTEEKLKEMLDFLESVREKLTPEKYASHKAELEARLVLLKEPFEEPKAEPVKVAESVPEKDEEGEEPEAEEKRNRKRNLNN